MTRAFLRRVLVEGGWFIVTPLGGRAARRGGEVAALRCGWTSGAGNQGSLSADLTGGGLFDWMGSVFPAVDIAAQFFL